MTPLAPTDSVDTHDAISERAADFLERRRFEEWSDANQAELDAWIAESFLHRAAYLRVEGAVTYTQHLAAVHAFKMGPKLPQLAPGSGRKLNYRRFVFPILAAASIGLFAAIGIPLANYLLQSPVRTFTTDVGGRTLLRFADGTEFELNTDTAVRYRMTNRERIVWLDKGEVWFHVAHNPKNPFAVVVGKHQIADIGTEFLIRRGSSRIEVALLAGGAALSTDGVQTAMLRPGDDAIAASISVSVTRKTAQELADKLAWRHGLLVFRNAELADAVREINRYYTTKLVIADSSIADLKFTGEIKDDNLEGFLYLAQSVMKLHVDRQGKEILLSREVPEKAKRAARAAHSL
jgi:transmembrane sensor